jgi:hypothetical protein
MENQTPKNNEIKFKKKKGKRDQSYKINKISSHKINKE